ncbi:MAG: N-acetyltransferase [Saprospiraceae bacterium]|nr:N-acetyltransferase [Saprospiraceae bacterium]
MIRAYQEYDIDEIIDIWFKASQLAHPFLDAAFLNKEKIKIREVYMPNTLTWVYSKENGLDGFISMIGNEVGAIFVRPEKHGQGIGKALMDYVNSFHNELEVEVFEHNMIGRAFYDRYGFKIIQEHMHEETNQKLFRMKFSR